MTSLDYDSVPYRGQVIPATSPACLSLLARAAGAPGLDLDGPLRVLEIGCGDGANLLPLAFSHPGWRLVGVDASRRAIDLARAGARALEVDNVELVCEDLASYAPDSRFDVVIAHGVYSWIDASARAGLRALSARALAPSGVAYLSFNAQPGWGVRGRVRDALTRGGTRDLASSRARLSDLAALLETPGNPWELLLAHEVERARGAADDYLAHEYLADDNEAFWLGDVVRDFSEHGLHYVCDALSNRVEGWVDPGFRARAAVMSDDAIEREELLDLASYRQLRAAVFSPTAPGDPIGEAILDDAFVAGALRRRNDPFDLSAGVPEPFDGPHGHEVQVTRPVAKAALLILAERYPEGLRFSDLLARAHAMLDEHGVRRDLAEARTEDGELKRGLYDLYRNLEIEVREQAPTLRTTAGAKPEATRLARYEAASGANLTTPLHTALPLEPIDRALVARLDGASSPDDVVASVVAAIASGQLDVEGAPSGAARLTPLVADRLARTLVTLGWWGLVT